MWEFSADRTDRLDRLLRTQNLSPWMGRQAWDVAIEESRVRVNGRVERKPGTQIPQGSILHIDLPPLGLKPDETPAELVWANDDHSLAVFQKEAGYPTYPLLPWEKGTLANGIARFVAEKSWMTAAEFAALSPAPVLEGGLLQRLDEHTSGLVTCALTAEAKASYRKVFSGAVNKGYLAIVTGDPGAIKARHQLFFPATEAPRVQASREMKPGSMVVWLSLKVLSYTAKNALVEVSTSHGVRHVVRAGMAALGFPLVGDELYGGGMEAPFHQLHAYSLQIPELERITSSPPQSFLDCLNNLGLSWKG
jgi:23S rRNA pseudouridine1911/1915/1917 synthase